MKLMVVVSIKDWLAELTDEDKKWLTYVYGDHIRVWEDIFYGVSMVVTSYSTLAVEDIRKHILYTIEEEYDIIYNRLEDGEGLPKNPEQRDTIMHEITSKIMQAIRKFTYREFDALCFDILNECKRCGIESLDNVQFDMLSLSNNTLVFTYKEE